jgi:monoamine oxidase
VLSALVPPERFGYLLALTEEDRDEVVRNELERLYGAGAREPSVIHHRLWGVDPYTLGYVTQWWPGDVLRVGPLHGTHAPPFYVCGSDQWVAGYLEGAVRTGRAAASAALGTRSL